MASINRAGIQGDRNPLRLLSSVTPAMRAWVAALYAATRYDPLLKLVWIGSGYRTGSSDHETRRAVDIITSERVGRLPTAAERQAGDRLASWLVANAKAMGVEVIVWHGRSWIPSRGTWKALSNRSGVSDWHYDHVHVRMSLRPRFVLNGLLPRVTTPAPPAGTVSLSGLINAAKTDPAKRDQSTTNYAAAIVVERALVAEGLLEDDLADGHYGTATVKAYGAWQRKLGYKGAGADGIPDHPSLEALAEAHDFEVAA